MTYDVIYHNEVFTVEACNPGIAIFQFCKSNDLILQPDDFQHGETSATGSVAEKGHRHPIYSRLSTNQTEEFTIQLGFKTGDYTKEELKAAAEDSGVTIEFRDEPEPRSILEFMAEWQKLIREAKTEKEANEGIDVVIDFGLGES